MCNATQKYMGGVLKYIIRKNLYSLKHSKLNFPQVENCSDNDQLPAKRGILKTPGSVRKKRMTLTFKTSPEINIIQSTPTSN